jgi:GT2 family glycosyltransferase
LVSSFHEWFETGLIKVTVLDDATPNTKILNIVQSHKNKYIEYVKNKKNLGLSQNFQKCIDISEGKYLWIPGADDIIFQFDVINFLRILNTAEFPFVAFGVSIINHLGEDYFPLQDIAKSLIRPKRHLLKRSTFSSKQVLARLMIGNFFTFQVSFGKLQKSECITFEMDSEHVWT